MVLDGLRQSGLHFDRLSANVPILAPRPRKQDQNTDRDRTQLTLSSIVLEGFDAEQRLHELGLRANRLRGALGYGYGYAASCTSHNPLTLPGTMAWGFTIGALRDDLVSDGWTVGRHRNLETVIHPSASHGVLVTSANSHAGNPGGELRTRYRKGDATALAVSQNAQMSLGLIATDQADVALLSEVEAQAGQTWLLLHRLDPMAEVIRAELSLPDYIEHGWITGWAERIMLEPIDFSTDVDMATDDGDDDIDIAVVRRA